MKYTDRGRIFQEAAGRIVCDVSLRDSLLTALGQNDMNEARRLLKAAGFELTPTELNNLQTNRQKIVRFLNAARAEAIQPW